MNDQVVFNIKINKNISGERGVDTFITAYTLKELNNFLNELETSFLGNLDDSIFIKEISKEEYISYINELGIKVKGCVKEYIIKDDLLEFILKLHLLKNKNFQDIQFIQDKIDLNIPFYTKKITVKKYFLEDISFHLLVYMKISDKRMDEEV